MNSRQEWPGWPVFDAEQQAAIQQVVSSGRVNYWTGSLGREFEQRFARYVGVGYGIAVANGSVAIGDALRALNVGPGDEIVVTPRSFIASASEIELTGARAVFADVDRDSQNLTPETVAPVISQRTKGIIAVHLAGWPCDMAGLLELAASKDLWIVEDCAQAHGAGIAGRPVGSFGRAATFSFCQDKIMSTAGEGGMIVTDDEALGSKAWSYKDHGKDYGRVSSPNESSAFRWVHAELGTNHRLTEIQSAVGLIQLGRLDEWVALRRRNAAVLTSLLSGLPGVRVPQPPDGVKHAYYKLYLFLEPGTLQANWNRDRVLQESVAQGVPAGTGVCPEIYREEAFTSRHGPIPRDLPVARELGETSLMLPVHPTLSESHMEQIGQIVAGVLRRALRLSRP